MFEETLETAFIEITLVSPRPTETMTGKRSQVEVFSTFKALEVQLRILAQVWLVVQRLW
jgi:hypothetical protein